jgi:hypothetical protein
MTPEFDGLQLHNGTTVVHVLSTGTELSGVIVSWAAISPSDHGAAAITPSTSTGRLTLVPGIYKIDVDLSIENATVSGLSSEDITVQDVVRFYLAKGRTAGQNPEEITGTSTQVAVEEGLPTAVHISAFVEITKAMLDDAINYISIFGETELSGGSASDIIIRHARFLAQRIG